MDENKNVVINISDVLLKETRFVRAEKIGFEKYKIVMVDKLVVSDVDINSFKIMYSRETSNNDPFYAIVVFDVFVSINDNDTKAFDDNPEKVKAFAEKRKNEIVSNLSLPARASLLIGNMTREVGSVPLVTSPVLIG